jgi:hypothetical protein
MRVPVSVLVIPFLFGISSVLGAQGKPATPAKEDNVSAVVRWNRLIPQFVAENTARRNTARAAAAGDPAALRKLAMSPAPYEFRLYTLESIAQYAALNLAGENRGVSQDVAIASASAAILSELFTDSVVRASIARELARDVDRAGSGAGASERIAASKAVGVDAARRVIAWAPVTNLVAPYSGVIPKGPGMWYSAPGIPPIGIAMVTSRTWLMNSPSQFRPGPPPEFGSPAWRAAIAEVKNIAQHRTPSQTKSAQYWDSGDPWGVWNDSASSALLRNHASNTEAARVLAVTNIGASDAIIACFDAKYHYWSIRPTQADSTIVLADSIGLPNFPSYPSGHACSAGAFDAALEHFFPSERAKYKSISEDQAMSRLYGGIHYRFDNDGGLALGRIVARYDVDQEKKGKLKSLPPAPVAVKP